MDKKCINKLGSSYKNLLLKQPYTITILASILASVGLTTNNYTAIIGSMVLSPIGEVIIKGVLSNYLKEDFNTIRIFLFIIFLSLLIGFLWGVLYININISSGFYKKKTFPTREMLDRAEISNAVFMIPIALVCGIVLPVAIRNKNISQLVGISISVALLPPLVNMGIALSTYTDKEIYDYQYVKNSLITGSIIFIINVVLLWIPSRLWFKYICNKKSKIGNFLRKLYP